MNVLPEAVEAIKDSLGDIDVKYNFAGSSILARQIVAGSPADIFLSADPFWMDFLVQKKLVDRSRIIQLLSNKLVVIVPVHSTKQVTHLDDLRNENIKFIALADPDHVPAGKYAKTSLEKADLWEVVSRKIVSAQDVRAAMAFVEAGEADAGIVYATDAKISSKVRSGFVLPEAIQPEIRYVLAPLNESSEKVALLVRLLQSQTARTIYLKHGFVIARSPKVTGQ